MYVTIYYISQIPPKYYPWGSIFSGRNANYLICEWAVGCRHFAPFQWACWWRFSLRLHVIECIYIDWLIIWDRADIVGRRPYCNCVDYSSLLLLFHEFDSLFGGPIVIVLIILLYYYYFTSSTAFLGAWTYSEVKSLKKLVCAWELAKNFRKFRRFHIRTLSLAPPTGF